MDESLSKMRNTAIKSAKWEKKHSPLTILTLLRGLIGGSILSLLIVNSLGAGLGYSNMRIYQRFKEIGQIEFVHSASKCFSPQNDVVKYVVPGFQIGCSIASILESK